MLFDPRYIRLSSGNCPFMRLFVHLKNGACDRIVAKEAKYLSFGGTE